MEIVKSTMKVIMKKMIFVRLVGECGFQRGGNWLTLSNFRGVIEVLLISGG